MNDPNKLTLEKMQINERLLLIEEYIKEGKLIRSQINETMNNINLRTTHLELMVHGDNKSMDKYVRSGMNRRIDELEEKEKTEAKTKEDLKKDFNNTATGAITIAVGGAIIWLFDVIREAFIKH